MARKNIHYYLIKTARISGWLLLPLMVLYIVTGLALCGEFGVRQVISSQAALEIHQIFEWPLLGSFLLHTSISIYFALRRWGWIKSRTCL